METTNVETGIPMPVNVGRGKGDARQNLVNAALGKFTAVGQSVLFPMANFEKAEEERRHFVNRVNKYGKKYDREYVVAAVAPIAPVPAVEADPENGVEAKPAIPGKPAGVRVWLKTILPPAEQPAEQAGQEAPKAEQNAEQAGQEAPEVTTA